MALVRHSNSLSGSVIERRFAGAARSSSMSWLQNQIQSIRMTVSISGGLQCHNLLIGPIVLDPMPER